MNSAPKLSPYLLLRPWLVFVVISFFQKYYLSLAAEQVKGTVLRQLQIATGCPVRQDVVFLIDSSESVAKSEFEKAKAFVLECLHGMSLPQVSIGVIRFDEEYSVILERELDKTRALYKVQKMDHQVGSTQMGPPLQAARTLFTTRTDIKTVVVVTDGNPTDWNATRAGAAALRDENIRLMFVTVGTKKNSASLLMEIATSPYNENVIFVESYAALPDMSSTFLNAIDLPCPCSMGQIANVSVGNLSGTLMLKDELAHAGSVSRDCEEVFPDFAGQIVLYCNDSNLTARQECKPTCVTGMQVLVSVGGLGKNVSLAESMLPGKSQKFICSDIFPRYRGDIVLSCGEDGVLNATHMCVPVCEASDQALVVLGTQEAFVNPHDEIRPGEIQQIPCADAFPDAVGQIQLQCQDGELVQTSVCVQRCGSGSRATVDANGVELQLVAPSDGLGTGEFRIWSCSEYLDDSYEGAVGIVCVDGQLYAFARCSEGTTSSPAPEQPTPAQPTPPVSMKSTTTPAPQNISTQQSVCTPIWERDPSALTPLSLPDMVFLGACAVAILAFLGCICLWCKLCRIRSKLRTEIVPLPKQAAPARSEPVPELPKPAPKPKPPPKPAPLPPPEKTVLPQPTTYVELVRGCQVPLDVVFCIDSSASVGAAGFRKATQFLNEVIGHMDLPVIQVGLIQFNDNLPFPFAAGITGDRSVLEANIRCMRFSVGETKMAPPLQAAAQMLVGSGRAATKLIFVLTDGDPNDLVAVREAVQEVKKQGIRLVFAHVGPLTTATLMQELASDPPERNVLHLDGYNFLLDAAAKVLSMIVENSMLVHRAKCKALFPPYTIVPDINEVDGWDLMCPGWVMNERNNWVWDADSASVIHDQKTVPWSLQEKTYKALLKDAGATTGLLALTLSDEKLHDGLSSGNEKIGSEEEVETMESAADGVILNLEAVLEATGEPAVKAVGAAGRKASSDSKKQSTDSMHQDAAPQDNVTARVISSGDREQSTDASKEPDAASQAANPRQEAQQQLQQAQEELHEVKEQISKSHTANPTPERQAETQEHQSRQRSRSPSTQSGGLRDQLAGSKLPIYQQKEASVQTDPCIRAKLATGRHVPMDVVFCLDSSASVCFLKGSNAQGAVVESGNFERAKSFVHRFVQECDMPEIHFGLIRFEDQSMVFSEMTGKKSEFSSRLRQMPFSVGETRMAAPLQEAKNLLQGTCRAVKKVVIVITDGEPNDYDETVLAVESLRGMGAKLLFIKVGAQGNSEKLRNLAFGKCGPASSTAASRSDVLEVRTYEELQTFVPEVLQRLVEATCWVHRASVHLTMPPYEVVDELMDDEGFKLDLTGHQIKDESIVPWHLALMKQCEGDVSSGAPPSVSNMEAVPLRPLGCHSQPALASVPSEEVASSMAAAAPHQAQLYEDENLLSLEKQAEVLRKNLASALRSTEEALAETKKKQNEISKARSSPPSQAASQVG